MISVSKNFDNIPNILLSGQENAWKDKSVINELIRLYNGKCAYCEQKTEKLYVTHYRPENQYFWLKNEWSNLLPICHECKQAKKNNFPIKGKPKTEVPKNRADFRANSEYLLSEEPLLVHPEIDNAENHFYFEKNGVIQGYTEKGRKTISTLRLYRDTLTKKREQIYDKYFFELKERIIRGKDSTDFFKELQEKTENKFEFSLFTKQLYYQFESFLYKDVIDEIYSSRFDLYKEVDSDAVNHGTPTEYIENLEPYEPNSTLVLINYFKTISGIDYEETHIANLINSFSILGFEIKKFQGIDKLRLQNIPLNTQWIFLTGENGFGKTSILKALLLGLIGNSEFKANEIDENTRIELMMLEQNDEVSDKIKYSIFGSYLFSGYKRNVAAYGAVRTFLNPTSDKIPVSANLFSSNKPEDVYVLNTESLLERLSGKPDLEPFKEQVINCLKLLIPKLSRIEIVPDKNKTDTVILYYEKDNDGNELNPVTFDQLAMGMRNIIGLIGDIVQRLSEGRDFLNSEKYSIFQIPNNPLKDLSELYGIVIIDEFDNHLHPSWQRYLVKKMSEIFPKIQFIVSTHSPIPLLGAPPERTVILNIDRNKENGIAIKRLEKVEKELPNLLPNSILTSPIFGLDSIKSEYNEDIDNLIVDDNYNDRAKYDKLDKKIDELFKSNNWEKNEIFKG